MRALSTLCNFLHAPPSSSVVLINIRTGSIFNFLHAPPSSYVVPTNMGTRCILSLLQPPTHLSLRVNLLHQFQKPCMLCCDFQRSPNMDVSLLLGSLAMAFSCLPSWESSPSQFWLKQTHKWSRSKVTNISTATSKQALFGVYFIPCTANMMSLPPYKCKCGLFSAEFLTDFAVLQNRNTWTCSRW